MRAPCLKCSNALSRKADPGLHWLAASAKGAFLPLLLPHSHTHSPTLKQPLHRAAACMRATINCSHAQTPKGSRPLLVCFVPSRTGPVPHTETVLITQQHGPPFSPLRWGEPDCQTFLGRWELAAPTTAAQARNSSSRMPERRGREI
jgi:hypothetical protein